MSQANAPPAPPTPAQRRAADPTSSAWVTASAGTGKTRVLADRVMRLLLAGADPRRILCLTFTKAAAAEMVKRVEAELARYAVLPEAELEAALAALAGRPSEPAERTRARTLLAEVLDLPAGLPIMTIHSFCQNLLKRFPLEAGVVPHFEVLDPRSAADLRRAAQAAVLGNAPAAVQAAIRRLAVLLGEVTLTEGLVALGEARLRIGRLLDDHGGVEPLIAALHDALGLPAGAAIEDIRRNACADPSLDRPALMAAAEVLLAGTGKEAERGRIVADWLAAEVAKRLETWPVYEGVFLTRERTGRQPGSLISKVSAAAAPAAERALLAEQARVLGWVEREKAAGVAERTAALLRVGGAVLAAYDARKRQLAALDFDDLIAFSRRLLDRPGMTTWVQYKLDQQIDHLLVDEGQDTSPEQWAILEALSAEFFAGEGARPAARTLFVVGDEKQSIMSVQGADVATYRRSRERFARLACAGRRPWREEPLGQSFRSARPILDLVDAVFADPAAREGVVSGPDWPAHECFLSGAKGLVEVWPLIEVAPDEKVTDWQLPDRHAATERAERRLAQAIARQIYRWRVDRVPLAATGAPIRPGDVMVLLPRRGVLQDLLIRALKQLQVPVAGADRLALTEELAVMDLIALGEALLLPEDDLTLAAVLRSPLFGLSDEELLRLAQDRGGASLFERLRGCRDEPPFGEAHDRFMGLLAQADFAPPYEFYARLLGEGGGRRRLLERLGPAAAEPIEAFLAQALAFERRHPPSLQAFLHWLRADTSELIRDPDRPRDEVRVLTCHGAKGQEAPIVFIADAGFVPNTRDRLLWTEDGLPLWRLGKAQRDRLSDAADERARRAQLEEHRRLLYVALTRARERLIVTGWRRDRAPPEPDWYQLVVDGMRRLGAVPVPAPADFELAGEILRYGDPPPAAGAQPGPPSAATRDAAAPPPWRERPAPAEAAAASPLSPSRATADDEPAALSPLVAGGSDRYRRGRVIHRLLQSLPDRPPAARPAAMARWLANPSLRLDPAEQAAIAAEVAAVLAMPALAAAFGPDARAEAPLAGVIGSRVIFGQVDRLAVTAEEVLILDYKTDRTPPATPAEVPRPYLRQMAAYRALLQRICPDRAVRCALLWTAGPTLMELDAAILAGHAPDAPQA